MRSKWKGLFILSKDNLYVNSSCFSLYLKIGAGIPVYNGKKWDLINYKHAYMFGYRVKNFVQPKLLGNIHSDKRKNRKKVGKKKKKWVML